MKFALGDTVRLLHSGEEGIVVELLNRDMVKVEVDGMEFPVFEDQLEYPYFERFVEMRKSKKKDKRKVDGAAIPKENAPKHKRKPSGMFLSCLPVYEAEEDAVVSRLKLYLANETNVSYTFHCKEYLKDQLTFEVESKAMPFNQFYLKDFSFDCLNDRPRLEFVFTPVDITAEMEPSYAYVLKLKARQVLKKIAELDNLQQAMFSYLLFEKYPLKVNKKEEQWDLPEGSSSIQYYKHTSSGISDSTYELDLHIEKLTDDYRGMASTDMLLLQISTLHNALDHAIAHRQYSMVVIHGIGKGVLKKEVHAVLKQTPEVKRFVNQHDFRYGFGATEIFFEYNT